MFQNSKKKPLSCILILVCLLLVSFSAGCVIYTDSNHNPNQNYQEKDYSNSYSDYYEDEDEDDQYYSQYSSSVETYTISGVEERFEVSNSHPVRLIVSGVANEIYVHKGTQVNEIIVSGVENTIYLPFGVSPRITKSGVDVQIIYY